MNKITSMMLNKDGSAYHLRALPEDIAPIVILVGDPMRVNIVAQHFDEIEVDKYHREFILKTGTIKKQRITVISTGIGTDNIDIVLNELDLLVNVNLKTGEANSPLKKLKIIRLGTCGSTSTGIPLDSIVISSYAFAFNDLLHYYQYSYNSDEKKILHSLKSHFHSFFLSRNLYLCQGDSSLINLFKPLGKIGITYTASGFYAPQGRKLRTPILQPSIIMLANQFKSDNEFIANIEMETSAIYGLGKLLGHQCCSISTVVANRITDEMSVNIEGSINEMIIKTLSLLTDQP